jgi:hypothetical protein
MKREKLDEIFACLDDERTLFYYFKDRYCLDLIDYYLDRKNTDLLSISELNKGDLRQFGHKEIVKNITKSCSNGFVHRKDVQAYWPNEFLTFVLTLDRWGDGDRGYDQTSRNQENLVLQINFDNKHIQEYRRLLRPDEYGPFEFRGHPVRDDNRKTLSWVRIDFDLSTGEALIEEVQNDWLRKAHSSLMSVRKRLSQRRSLKPGDIVYGIHCEYTHLNEYVEQVLEPYNKLWAEASMLAAIHFIRKELGISIIYYHTFDTGKKIKKIFSSPPKSMYTQLPKKFGFELTEESPKFIQEDKCSRRYLKAIQNPLWYRLLV